MLRVSDVRRDSSRALAVKTEAAVVDFKPESLTVGRQLGEGSFGVVYEVCASENCEESRHPYDKLRPLSYGFKT